MALTTAQIQQAYVTFFSRPADAAGLNYWSSYGGSVADLYATFAQQTEYTAAFSNLSSAQKVNVVYQNLFGRDAEPTGLLYWAKALDAGSVTVANLALAVSAGSQGTDGATVANRVTAATAFTAALDTTAKILGYSGTAANASAKTWLSSVVDTAASLTAATAGVATAVANTTAVGGAAGSTFTLTTGVDSFTGTSGTDTFIADNTAGAGKYTFTVADTVSGGAGVDTLKVYSDGLVGGVTFTSSQITGVENLYVNNLAGTGTGVALDVSKVAGLTAVTLDAPYSAVIGADSADTITLAGQSLTISNVAKAITGTNKVTFTVASTTDTTENITVNGLVQTNATGKAVTVDVTGAKVTSETITATGAASTINLANTTGAAITTLTVLGDKKLTATTSAAMSAALKVIDASGDTGGVAIDITGGTAQAKLAFTGGSGNDTLTLTGASLVKTQVLNGGAGTDTLAIDSGAIDSTTTTLNSGINAAAGFEVLGLTISTAATNAATASTLAVDASQITSVTSFDVITGIDNSALAQATANNAGVAGVTFTGTSNAQTFIFDGAVKGQTGAGTGAGGAAVSFTPALDNGTNVLNVVLNGVALTGGAAAGAGSTGGNAIAASTIETLNIVSNNNSAASATTNTLAGGGQTGGAGTVGSGIVINSNGTVNISGALDLDTGVVAYTNATLNAGALAGKLTTTINDSGNDTVVGAIGGNAITLAGGGVDTVDLTKSTKADAIVISTAVGSATSSTALNTITGYTLGSDTIKLNGSGAISSATASATDGTTGLTYTISSKGILSFSGATSSTTFANYISDAFLAIHSASNKTAAFVLNGDTYLVQDNGTADAFNSASDYVVKLTGVVATSLTAASGVITVS